MVRRKNVSKNKGFFSFKRLIFILTVLACVGYIVYFLITFFSIKTLDPLSENISKHKILSQINNGLDKIVYIIEKGEGADRRISDIYVFLENSTKEVSLLVYIPGSLYFEGLEESFGSSISISSLRYAGDFLQEGRGVEYTLWQLNEILGFKVDNYIWMTSEAYSQMEMIYGDMSALKDKDKQKYQTDTDGLLSESFFKIHSISMNYSSLKTFFNINKVSELSGSIYSNLSFTSVLRSINKLDSTVSSTTTYAMDLGSVMYSKDNLSEKGGQLRSINITEYDKSLRNYLSKMLDKDLEKERVRVEVYNASGVSGKAGVYSRKILNSGCDVVRYGNAPGSGEYTQLYVSNKEDFINSFDVVSEVLLGKYQEVSDRPSFMTTGDIVVILGEDISQIEIF